MKNHFFKAFLITLLSFASVLGQRPNPSQSQPQPQPKPNPSQPKPIDFDYEDDLPFQSGGHRSVPTFVNVHEHPKTGFSCADKQAGQYYADPETKCAVYYVCIPNERGTLSAQSFACPNGTIFSQSTKVCADHEQVYCQLSTRFYDSVNGNIDSKGLESTYARSPSLQPWRAQASRPKPQTQPQPQAQPQPQDQSQPQSRPQPQARPQPQPRPQPSRPVPNPLSTQTQNSRRGQFGTTSTTSSTTAAPIEYEYEYVDYGLPNDTNTQGRPAVLPAVRSKRETSPIRRKGQLPSPFEFLSAPHIITSFKCEDKVPGIAYADTHTDCKMFHVCIPFAKGKLKDYQMYCESNKAFNQESGVCEPKEKVNCGRSLKFYVYNKWFRPQESRKDSWKALMKKSTKQ